MRFKTNIDINSLEYQMKIEPIKWPRVRNKSCDSNTFISFQVTTILISILNFIQHSTIFYFEDNFEIKFERW